MISVELAKAEYLKNRHNIFVYFAENYSASIQSILREIGMQDKSFTVDEGPLGSHFSFAFSEWLRTSKLSKTEDTPMNTYTLDQCDIDLPLADMIELRKMAETSFMGIFKPLKFQSYTSILSRNIISGENIVINLIDEDPNIDEKLFLSSMLLQKIECWKGHWLCCGGGHIVPNEALAMIIADYKNRTASFARNYYSSGNNRKKAYEILDNAKTIFTKSLGTHPLTFSNYAEYSQKMPLYFKAKNMSDELIKQAIELEKHQLEKGKSEITAWISHEGEFTFIDLLNITKDIKQFSSMPKNEKVQFLDFFAGYLEAVNMVPTEVLYRFFEDYPKEMQSIFSELKKYYDIDFPDQESLIEFFRPLHKNPIPGLVIMDTRLTDYINNGKTKIGRNDSCPCGSEKKFKKCCGFVF